MTPKDGRPDPVEPFGGFGKTFGRRKGRPLRGYHASLVETLLPQIEIVLPGTKSRDERAEGEPGVDPQSVEPQAFFGPSPPDQIWLEIGYGGGEHLAGQAGANRDVGLIGAEFFAAGVGKMLAHIDDGKLENVRLCTGDGRAVLASLTSASLDRVFVLFPDPWPKTRHERRRFISPWSVAQFARLVKPGGTVRVASDIPAYCRWTLQHFGASEHFELCAERSADWHDAPTDWFPTRYQAKAIREGRTPAWLDFRRL